jgi:hypothetical protein
MPSTLHPVPTSFERLSWNIPRRLCSGWRGPLRTSSPIPSFDGSGNASADSGRAYPNCSAVLGPTCHRSVVTCAADSRRTPDARDRRAHRLRHAPDSPPSTFSDVASITDTNVLQSGSLIRSIIAEPQIAVCTFCGTRAGTGNPWKIGNLQFLSQIVIYESHNL